MSGRPAELDAARAPDQVLFHVVLVISTMLLVLAAFADGPLGFWPVVLGAVFLTMRRVAAAPDREAGRASRRVAASPELVALVARLSHEVGLDRPPELWVKEGSAEGPSVASSWTRERLMLGERHGQTAEALARDEESGLTGLEAVLLHELAHLRQADGRTVLLAVALAEVTAWGAAWLWLFFLGWFWLLELGWEQLLPHPPAVVFGAIEDNFLDGRRLLTPLAEGLGDWESLTARLELQDLHDLRTHVLGNLLPLSLLSAVLGAWSWRGLVRARELQADHRARQVILRRAGGLSLAAGGALLSGHEDLMAQVLGPSDRSHPSGAERLRNLLEPERLRGVLWRRALGLGWVLLLFQLLVASTSVGVRVADLPLVLPVILGGLLLSLDLLDRVRVEEVGVPAVLTAVVLLLAPGAAALVLNLAVLLLGALLAPEALTAGLDGVVQILQLGGAAPLEGPLLPLLGELAVVKLLELLICGGGVAALALATRWLVLGSMARADAQGVAPEGGGAGRPPLALAGILLLHLVVALGVLPGLGLLVGASPSVLLLVLGWANAGALVVLAVVIGRRWLGRGAP